MNKKKVVLADFPFTLNLRVSWGQMDAFRHVNNTVFIRFFEDVRIAYFERASLSYSEMNSIGPILAEVSCKFIRPIHYPEEVIAAASVSVLEEDRFRMAYGLFSQKDERCYAIGEGVVMAYDYAKGAKVNVPELWCDGIKTINKNLS